jgi:hypothetical protein
MMKNELALRLKSLTTAFLDLPEDAIITYSAEMQCALEQMEKNVSSVHIPLVKAAKDFFLEKIQPLVETWKQFEKIDAFQLSSMSDEQRTIRLKRFQDELAKFNEMTAGRSPRIVSKIHNGYNFGR